MAGGFNSRYSLPNLRQYRAAVKAAGEATIKQIARAITQAALNVDHDAKVAAAVDVGGLRARIRPVLDASGLAASVIANTKHAAFVEFGTGPLGRATNTQPLPPGYVHGGPYFPNPDKLAPWARRHKLDPYLVARGIFRRGGTKARPFLGPAFEKHGAILVKRMEEILRGGSA